MTTIEETIAELYAIVTRVAALGDVGLSRVLGGYVEAYQYSFESSRRVPARKMRRLSASNPWGTPMGADVVALLIQAADVAERGLTVGLVPPAVSVREEDTMEGARDRSEFFHRLSAKERDTTLPRFELAVFEHRVRRHHLG